MIKFTFILLLLSVSIHAAKTSVEKDRLLVMAVSTKSLPVVKALLDDGADINARDSIGQTPLHLAIKKSDPEVALFLIERGADVNSKDDKGITPLMVAADRENLKILEKLLSKKVSIDETNNRGWTALRYAASGNNRKFIEILLKHNASMDKFPRTPGSKYDHWVDNFRVLLEHGYKTTSPDSCSFNLVNYAVFKDSLIEPVINCVTDGIPRKKFIREVALQSAKSGEFMTLQKLFKRWGGFLQNDKEFVSFMDSLRISGHYMKGFTPLMQAILFHDSLTVKTLLSDSLIKKQSYNHWNALHVAALSGEAWIVKEIINHGFNLNQYNECDNGTPLMLAVSSGSIETVKSLLNAGANCDDTLRYNKAATALTIAASHNNYAMAKLLLDNGCLADAPRDDCWSPLSWAAYHGNDSLVQLLLKKQVNLNQICTYTKSINWDITGITPLMLAAIKEHNSTAKLLIDGNANVNMHDNDGNSVLDYAISQHNPELVKLLLEKGAGTHGPECNENRYSKPALISAYEESDKELIDLLIAKGADPKIQNCDGKTPLMAAAKTGNLSFVESILPLSGDCNKVSSYDYTALSYAAMNGDEAMVRFLAKHGAKVVIDSLKNDNKPEPVCLIRGAGYKSSVELIKFLIEQTPASRTIEKYELLQSAIEGWNEPVVKYILDNIFDKSPDSVKTVITKAALSNWNYQTLNYLLRKGIKPDTRIPNYYTGYRSFYDIPLLCIAVGNNDLVSTKILLDAGADINATTKEGYSALMIACYNGYKDMVQTLVDKGGSLVQMAKGGETPLTIVINKHYTDIFYWLLENKKVNLSKNALDSLLMSALKTNLYPLAKVLLEHGATIKDTSGTDILYSIWYNKGYTLLPPLLKSGVNINSVDTRGQTLLWKAVMNNLDSIKLLLKLGANPDIIDKSGTSLITAVALNNDTSALVHLLNGGAKLKQSQTEDPPLIIRILQSYRSKSYRTESDIRKTAATIRILIEGGADLNASDNNGKTALMEASQNDDTVLVALLLEKGAPVNTRDKKGRTALMWAQGPSGNPKCAAVLKANGGLEE